MTDDNTTYPRNQHPGRNYALLKETMDKINSLPDMEELRKRFDPNNLYSTLSNLEFAAQGGILEVWNQADWYQQFGEELCGTAGCFAGWGIHLSGMNPTEVYDIRQTAQVLFGLTYEDAYTLFHGANTREQLNRYVNNLLAGRDAYTDDPDA